MKQSIVVLAAVLVSCGSVAGLDAGGGGGSGGSPTGGSGGSTGGGGGSVSDGGAVFALSGAPFVPSTAIAAYGRLPSGAADRSTTFFMLSDITSLECPGTIANASTAAGHLLIAQAFTVDGGKLQPGTYPVVAPGTVPGGPGAAIGYQQLAGGMTVDQAVSASGRMNLSVVGPTRVTGDLSAQAVFVDGGTASWSSTFDVPLCQ